MTTPPTLKEAWRIAREMVRWWKLTLAMAGSGAILGAIGGFNYGHLYVGAGVGAGYALVALAALMHEAKSFGGEG